MARSGRWVALRRTRAIARATSAVRTRMRRNERRDEDPTAELTTRSV
ncbi:MAG: hypothetical protein ACRDLS_00555 [Solirubrobacteraceae bacterium]